MAKVLVNIHGAGRQMSDFYREALTALTGILHTEPACLACWYADPSNIGSAVLGLEDQDLSPLPSNFVPNLQQMVRFWRNHQVLKMIADWLR